eukprot:s480_g6.t1
MLKEHGPKKLLLCLYPQRFILVELKLGEFHPPEVQHGATSAHIDASTVEEGALPTTKLSLRQLRFLRSTSKSCRSTQF